MIQHLRNLPTEKVEMFLKTREAESLGIPTKLAEYILQINEASNLHKRFHSIQKCAEELQKSYPKLSIPTCKSRIYDAMNYLQADCSVTAEGWAEYGADMFMKLFEVCLVAKDFKAAGKYLQKSIDYRIQAAATAMDPERLKFKHQIVSPDFVLERMFIDKKDKKKGLLNAFKESILIINNAEINDTDKNRMFDELRHEFNFTDAEYEEITN